MADFADRSRYEYKYRIELDKIPGIREYTKQFTRLDPHLKATGGNEYTVRSIYYDTESLDFYYEKMDGLKLRKKLRIRTYNDNNDYAFLEIKRKYINCTLKERSKLPFETVEKLVNTNEESSVEIVKGDRNSQIVTSKFRYNLLKKDLVPTILIVYEREAYVGLEDENVRLTIDTNVRAVAKPELENIFDDQGFVSSNQESGILELKFDDFMPCWMKDLVHKFRLKNESISKYCTGIEVCGNLIFNGALNE